MEEAGGGRGETHSNRHRAEAIETDTSGGARTGTLAFVTDILPLPGFYPDPEHPGRHRWWDGNDWAVLDDEDNPDEAPSEPEPEIEPVTNQMALFSMICSIGWIFFVGSIVGVITGHLAMREIRSSDGQQVGRGAATIGLFLGYLGVFCGLMVALIWAS